MKKRTRKSVLSPRKTPAQSRSAETVTVVLEAAARILEERGLEGYNTNAVAEKAGVSIGSVYQYFRNKDSLLAALIEQESELFVASLESLLPELPFRVALRRIIEAAIEHQLHRPELGRLIDFVEKQALFQPQAERMITRIRAVLLRLLARPDAPPTDDAATAATDFLSLVRALTDAAGERRERDRARLADRIDRAACGYFGLPVLPARDQADRHV